MGKKSAARHAGRRYTDKIDFGWRAQRRSHRRSVPAVRLVAADASRCGRFSRSTPCCRCAIGPAGRDCAVAGAVKKEQATPADASVIKADISSNWQAANLASVVKYDPFALPASFPQRPKPGDEEKTAQETVKTEDAKAVEAARVEAIKAVQTMRGTAASGCPHRHAAAGQIRLGRRTHDPRG